MELGIGESLLIKAISESTGRSISTLKAELKKEGDLGLVAMVCRRILAPDHVDDDIFQRTPRTVKKHSLNRSL